MNLSSRDFATYTVRIVKKTIRGIDCYVQDTKIMVIVIVVNYKSKKIGILFVFAKLSLLIYILFQMSMTS